MELRRNGRDTATFFHLSVPQSPDLCEGLHASVHHRRETALLCVPLRKVYRFPTEDQRWLTVRDELSKTPLSFSLPRQLLSVLVHEHATRYGYLLVLSFTSVSESFSLTRSSVNSVCDAL